MFSLHSANGQPTSTPPTPGAPLSAPPASGPPTSGAASAGAPLSTAPGSAPSMGAPATAGTTPATTAKTTLVHTIGISPTQPTIQRGFNVFGGTGNGGGESYDLQSQNVYSLLQERGVAIPNVLHPDSTAKPSFIIERLIVLSITGASGKSGGNNNSAPSSPSAPTGVPSRAGGGNTTTQASGPTDAELTVSAVRRVVDAEISRGSGRIGGTHRRKLQFLRAAIHSLEQANQLGNTISTVISGTARGGAAPSSGQGTSSSDKIDPREIFYGNARNYARAADQLAPKGY